MSLPSKVDEILARLGGIDTASSTIDVETVELAVSFIKNDLLAWLDDLASKGRRDDAAFLMKKLMKKLEAVLLEQARDEKGEPLKTQHFKQLKGEVLEHLGENELSHIASLIRDGIQLLRLHTSENNLASKHPSSVIFYPEESALKQEWMAENKAWLVTPPKMTHSWSNIPSTLNTGRKLDLHSIAISPCGRILATRSRTHEIRLWDAETGAALRPTPELLKEEAWHIDFSPGGQLASASVDHTLRIWDVNTGKILNAWPLEGHSITALRFSPNSEGGEELVLATSDALLLWKSPDFGKPQCKFTEEVIEKGHIKGNYISAVDFSQQGTWIASGTAGGDIKIRDARHGNALHQTFQAHGKRINSIAFSWDEKCLISGSDDSTFKIWSVETGSFLKSLSCGWPIRAVAFSPDGSFIAAGFGRHVRVWDIESEDLRYVMNCHEETVYAIAFSPQGRLVSASHDANIQLWDIEGSVSNDTNAPSESPSCSLVNSMTMSPDGKYLASASGFYIYLWDGMTGMPMDVHELFQERQVLSISFSPDGKYLVVSSTGGIVRVWDVVKGNIYRIFEGHSDDCTSATFSPDGNYIASSSCDKTVRIRSLLPGAEGEDAIILKGHKGKVITVAFSPDGRSLVSGDDRSNVIIWDRESLQQKHRLTGHGYIAKVVFSQDSSRIVSRSEDNASHPKSNTVCVWDATTGNIIHGPQTISWPCWPYYNQRMGFSLEMSEYFLYLAECGIDPSALGLSPTVVAGGRRVSRYRVAQDGDWITCNGKNIISIPKMYRPEASWVQGNTVALGTKRGNVFLFRFSAEDEAYEEVRQSAPSTVEKYEDVLNQSLEGIQDAPRIATPEGAVLEISRQWDVRFEQMGYLLDQWLQHARCVNIDEGQAVLRHYLENSWELLQYPVPWTCLCWAVESLVIHPLSDPKFRKLLVITITKMGYYIRLSRIVPNGPPAHREHLRQLLRMLYKTVLQFSMILVAYPNSDYLLEPSNAEIIRAEFSNRERELITFESSWLHPRLESALGAVPEPNDHSTDTSYDYMMSSEPELTNDHGSDTSSDYMMSSEPDSETLDHPTSSDYAPTTSRGQSTTSRSQSTSPGLRYCIHRSAIESRRAGTVSV